MIVDISPMIVNRTAVYHLVRETVKFLRDRGYSFDLYAVGEKIDSQRFFSSDCTIDEEVRGRLFAKLIDRIDSSKPVEYRSWREAVVDGGCFVFDPLYLMFLPHFKNMACMVHDLTPVTKPQWHGTNVALKYQQSYELLYDKNIRLVSVSESTKNDLWANFGIGSERIDILGLYDRFNSNFRSPASRTKEFLFVGSLEARKNVVGLIRGFELSKLSKDGYTLNIVGGDALGSDHVKSAASSVAGVYVLGRIDDSQLSAIYDRCLALAYPSFWEGFGLPALEAANRGVPMVLSETGALPEIVGPHAVYVDPASDLSISHGLTEMADLSRREHDYLCIARDAQTYAKKYSYEKYMTGILRIMHDHCSLSAV